MIHELADVKSNNVGNSTTIWQYCVVLPGAKIGEGCNICAHVLIENDVIVGDNVTIKSGVQLWDGVVIESEVFVGPNVTFTNDPFPRSRKRPQKYSKTIIRQGASIGANATILPGVVVGECAMIGAGAVVTKSVPPYAIVVGNPATIVGYVDAESPVHADEMEAGNREIQATSVRGVTIHHFPNISDIRGNLTVGEFEKKIPFRPKRYFMVYGVPSKETRGAHAHHKCEQFLICVHGSCCLVADDGKSRIEVVLNSPSVGVYLPPKIWGIQYKYSSDAILLVFASDYYDSEDYIRSYAEFKNIIGVVGDEEN